VASLTAGGRSTPLLPEQWTLFRGDQVKLALLERFIFAAREHPKAKELLRWVRLFRVGLV
jgi:hypothetical protein